MVGLRRSIATHMASNSDEISCETSGFCHVHVRLDLKRMLFSQKKKEEAFNAYPMIQARKGHFCAQNLLFNSPHFLESKVSYLF
jgi:hypothetical protein